MDHWCSCPVLPYIKNQRFLKCVFSFMSYWMKKSFKEGGADVDPLAKKAKT